MNKNCSKRYDFCPLQMYIQQKYDKVERVKLEIYQHDSYRCPLQKDSCKYYNDMPLDGRKGFLDV